MINFITLKWGTKYGPEYVNRLYNSIKKHYNKPFTFTCITDDTRGVICDTLPLSNLSLHSAKGIFTSKKFDLFKIYNKGNCCLLDLDILIINDLTSYFDSYGFSEPRFILNRWQDHSRIYNSFFTNDCFINSSFVTWKDNQLEWLFDSFIDNLDIIEYRYKTVDKFIFYSSFDKISFHPPKFVYAYSFGAEYDNDLTPFEYRPDYSVVLFHTSHKKPEGVELHDADGWARNIWLSND